MPLLCLIAGYVPCTTTGDMQRVYVCVLLGVSFTVLDTFCYIYANTLYFSLDTLLICTLVIIEYLNSLLFSVLFCIFKQIDIPIMEAKLKRLSFL